MSEKPEKVPSALKSIRKHCVECSGGSHAEVKRCVIPECNLYPYRMGKSPNRKGTGGRGNIEALRKWREKEAKK